MQVDRSPSYYAKYPLTLKDEGLSSLQKLKITVAGGVLLLAGAWGFSAYQNVVTPSRSVADLGYGRGSVEGDRQYYATRELVEGQGVPVFDPNDHEKPSGWTLPGIVAVGTFSKDGYFRSQVQIYDKGEDGELVPEFTQTGIVQKSVDIPNTYLISAQTTITR